MLSVLGLAASARDQGRSGVVANNAALSLIQ
jgi:hypothetical protein